MNYVKRFHANCKGRDFVVGDIHGCTDRLAELLRQAEFKKDRDRLFSVGDLCDRGPDSLGALNLIYEPWFHAVRGNHEQMMVSVIVEDGDSLMWWVNGGQWAVGEDVATLKTIAGAVADLPYAIVVGEGVGRFNVLHAEFFGSDSDLDAGDFDDRTRTLMLWGRDLISGHADRKSQAGLSTTYVGHTIRPFVQRVGSHVFIDTGAYRSGQLTMIEPATGNEWSTA